jgi:hypothetical protein
MVIYQVALMLSLVLVMAIQRPLVANEIYARTHSLTIERQERLRIVREADKRYLQANRLAALMHPRGLVAYAAGSSLYFAASSRPLSLIGSTQSSLLLALSSSFWRRWHSM